MDHVVSLIVRLMVLVSHLVPILLFKGCRPWSPGTPVKVLLVGYNGGPQHRVRRKGVGIGRAAAEVGRPQRLEHIRHLA